MVKRGPVTRFITLIDRSGSADRTAIEHPDRWIKVVHFITVPRFTVSVIALSYISKAIRRLYLQSNSTKTSLLVLLRCDRMWRSPAGLRRGRGEQVRDGVLREKEAVRATKAP
eukprot:1186547-Prorocentrum_minimum.AAC.2